MLKEERASQGISPVERLNMLVAADMQAADRLIRKGMASSVELIPDLARHLIESGGKRLRPLLTLAVPAPADRPYRDRGDRAQPRTPLLARVPDLLLRFPPAHLGAPGVSTPCVRRQLGPVTTAPRWSRANN